MRGILGALLIVALSVALGAEMYRLDIQNGAPDPLHVADNLAHQPRVDAVVNWHHQTRSPTSGELLWEVSGARAVPLEQTTLQTIFRVDEPHLRQWAPGPVTASAQSAIAVVRARGDATITFERSILVQQPGSSFRGEKMILDILPDAEGRADLEGKSRLLSQDPVEVEYDDPRARFTASGLAALAETQECTLAPPVHGVIDAAALARVDGDGSTGSAMSARKGETLVIDTDAPVRIVEKGKGAYDVVLTGPARSRYLRADGGEAFTSPGPRRGGVIRLRKPEAPEKPRVEKQMGAIEKKIERAPASIDLDGDIEILGGERLVAWGETVRWDRASAVATLTGDGARPALLAQPDARGTATARVIRYLARTSEAELLGDASCLVPYRPKTQAGSESSARASEELSGDWRILAPYALVHFAPDRSLQTITAMGAATESPGPIPIAATPVPIIVQQENGDARGEASVARYTAKDGALELDAADGPTAPLARFTRGASALAARKMLIGWSAGGATLTGDVQADLASELWGGAAALGSKKNPGDEAIRLAGSDWHVESDRLALRFAPGGGTLSAVDLEGDEREALLQGHPHAPGEPAYEARGARISADRAAGTVTLTPAAGSRSRQTLVRGPDRLEAREIRYDEARGIAVATGEAVFTRAAQEGEPPLRAEAAEVELRFLAKSATATAVRPAQVVARGRVDAPVIVTRADPEKPLRLTARRIEGDFDPTSGKLAQVRIEGDGTPVLLEPAYALPASERFRLSGGRIVYDAIADSGEVFGMTDGPEASRGPPGAIRGPPQAIRGTEENLTAKRVLFDLRTKSIALRDSVRGKFFAPVPADLLPTRTPARGAESKRESLFDLEADQADLSLAYGLAAVDARGNVRFHDAASDVQADHAVYRRESSTVLLEGAPVRILRGGNKDATSRAITIRLDTPDDHKNDQKKKESPP